jgi:hypothetical protein
MINSCSGGSSPQIRSVNGAKCTGWGVRNDRELLCCSSSPLTGEDKGEGANRITPHPFLLAQESVSQYRTASHLSSRAQRGILHFQPLQGQDFSAEFILSKAEGPRNDNCDTVSKGRRKTIFESTASERVG